MSSKLGRLKTRLRTCAVCHKDLPVDERLVSLKTGVKATCQECQAKKKALLPPFRPPEPDPCNPTWTCARCGRKGSGSLVGWQTWSRARGFICPECHAVVKTGPAIFLDDQFFADTSERCCGDCANWSSFCSRWFVPERARNLTRCYWDPSRFRPAFPPEAFLPPPPLAGVAQLAEQGTVTPPVAGSTPVTRPSSPDAPQAAPTPEPSGVPGELPAPVPAPPRPPSEPFVVKVQVSIPPGPVGECLVHNRDWSVCWHGKTPPKTTELLKGREKAYFNVHWVFSPVVVIDVIDEATGQEW